MSTESAAAKVIRAVKSAIPDIPVFNGVYTGELMRYAVFTETIPRAYFADDKAEEVVVSVRVHFFTDIHENTTQLKRAVRKALETEGFNYPTQEDASDEDTQHIVWDTEISMGA